MPGNCVRRDCRHTADARHRNAYGQCSRPPDPQQSEHSDATANPESDTTQSPHMQTDGSDAGASTHGLINLNTATAEELQSIKGIGPVTAQRIIDHRTAIGGYTSVDQLLDVKGIGSKTLETMRGQVTVG